MKIMRVAGICLLGGVCLFAQTARDSRQADLQAKAPSRPSLKTSGEILDTIDLGSIAADEKENNDRRVPRGSSARAVSRTPGPALLARGVWMEDAKSSRYWSIRVSGKNAVATRVRFESFHAGAGQMWLWASDGKTQREVGPYTKDGSFGDGSFWTDLLPGETFTIEFRPDGGSGAPIHELPFEIAEVQLFYSFTPLAQIAYPGPSTDGIDRSCFRDAICYANNAGDASALRYSVYLIVPNVSSCSGTMMNTKAQNTLLLTAGHCLSPGDERSLVIFPKYQTSSCGGSYDSDVYNFFHVTGATLLGYSFSGSTNSAGDKTADPSVPDYAVLRLSSNAGTATSGWSTSDPVTGQLFWSASHPRNMPVSEFQPKLDSISGNLLKVVPLSGADAGRVDHGSSGSGIHDSTGVYLYGVLSTIPNGSAVSACSVPNFFVNYTRFRVIYDATKQYWEDTTTTSPVINSFTATLSSINAGQSSTLQWSVANADTVTIDPGVGTVPLSGSRAVSPSSTTTYTLTATKAGAPPVTSTVTIVVNTVQTGPPVVSFTASPATISAGGSSTLTWNVSGASSVSISPGIGTVAASGSRAVSPSSTTTYTLTAGYSGGSVNANATVTVGATPPLISFNASPATISAGGSSTLAWNVSGASSVSISPGIGTVAASGTRAVSPGSTTTYTLTAGYSRGSVNANTTVSVSSGNPSRPSINLGGVVTVSAGAQSLTPLGLVSIYGQRFTNNVTQSWNGAQLTTTLAGVSVTIDGKAAYPLFVSPTFINVQVPDSATRGLVPVTVTNSSGASDAVMVTMAAVAPEFKGWSTTEIEANRGGPRPQVSPTCPYEACPVAPAGLVPYSAPAQPGESISLWALGWGASRPAIAAGTIGAALPLVNSVTVTIGGVTATAPYGAFLQGVGLYQINIVVPQLPDGEYDVIATVGGVQTLKAMRLAIKH